MHIPQCRAVVTADDDYGSCYINNAECKHKVSHRLYFKLVQISIQITEFSGICEKRNPTAVTVGTLLNQFANVEL